MKESLGEYRTRDGKSLSFRKWDGIGNVIVYLHGIESNSGWFSPFAAELNKKGFTLYGIDRRGTGLNKEGNRGDIADYNIFLDDIEDAISFVKKQNTGKKIFLMGICWGALLAVNYITKGRPMPDGLILLSPAIYRKIDFSIYVKAIAKLCYLISPQIRFNIPIKDRMFTSNARYLDFIKKDKMRLRRLTCRFFNEILRMENELSGINFKTAPPILVLLAGEDDIVDNRKIKDWFRKLESADKTIKMFDDFYHVMPFEDNNDSLINFIADWVKAREASLEHESVSN